VVYQNGANEIKERLGRSLVDMLRKSFDELRTSITEVEVENWIRLVNSERMYAITDAIKRLMEPTVQQTADRKSSERDEKLRHMLKQLDQPIIQITAHVSALYDKFTSMF
jgi:hypothetical protein